MKERQKQRVPVKAIVAAPEGRDLTEECYQAAFASGYIDAVLAMRYNDGINPSHRLLVLCPLGGSPAVAGYRDGWLMGMRARFSA